jgi:hypothetical protein
MISPRKPLFKALREIVTTGAINPLADACLPVEIVLDRHYHGDWGDTDPDDAEKNDAAIRSGGRVLSAYSLSTGVRIWVLTEQERDDGTRAVTTVLLPAEY